ncbi:MAG TPA: hypothetical protein P5556_03090 [Candidatus Gastranaerophilales bacterium]|nr:hypothetical protein [Candidatus Gastranaerophilales bacterium]
MNDKIKEAISFFKLLLTFLVTLDAGCTAWLFQNFKNVSIFQKNLSYLAIITLTFMAFILIKAISAFLRELKE